MPRRRHIPIRTCVLSGQKSPKSRMLRIVRLEDGSIAIDEGQRIDGRGCYVCIGNGKLDLTELKGKIKRALRLESNVPAEFIQHLSTRLSSK
jgi:predicted RNA-binding protein YlxR (DUF448 family)